MPTMFAAYDRNGNQEPRFFALNDTADDSATIADRAYNLGVSMFKGYTMREVVGLSNASALVHFGTLARFLDTGAHDIAAAYAIGATEADKDGLVRMAEIATLDPDFMRGMWEHRRPRKNVRTGRMTPEQEHLHIALVTDLQAPARYAANVIGTEATA